MGGGEQNPQKKTRGGGKKRTESHIIGGERNLEGELNPDVREILTKNTGTSQYPERGGKGESRAAGKELCSLILFSKKGGERSSSA